VLPIFAILVLSIDTSFAFTTLAQPEQPGGLLPWNEAALSRLQKLGML
jgi:hypothetical protein